MNIKELKKAIEQMEEMHGNMDEVSILYRRTYDSDIEVVNFFEEDLFLADDNNTLESVCFMTTNQESEAVDEEPILEVDLV